MTWPWGIRGYPITLECTMRHAHEHAIPVPPDEEWQIFHEVVKEIADRSRLRGILRLVNRDTEIVCALYADYHAKTPREARARLDSDSLPSEQRMINLITLLDIDENPKWWRYEDGRCPMPGDPDYTEEDNDYWCEEYDRSNTEVAAYDAECAAEEKLLEDMVDYELEALENELEETGEADIEDDVAYVDENGVQWVWEEVADDESEELNLGEEAAQLGHDSLVEDDGADDDDSSTERADSDEEDAARALQVTIVPQESQDEKGIQLDFDIESGVELKSIVVIDDAVRVSASP